MDRAKMMRFAAVAFVGLVFFALPNAHSASWYKTFGGSEDDIAESVRRTADDGYILIGQSKSFGNPSGNIYLVKTDSLGNKEWEKSYGGSTYSWGRGVQQTADGGYIIAATARNASGKTDTWLIKTDPDGNQDWLQTYSKAGSSLYVNSVQQTADGGFLFCSNESMTNIYVVKTVSNGNIEWSRTIDIGDKIWEDDGAYAIQIRDGGYVITQSKQRTCPPDGDCWDIYLAKLDTAGDTVWEKVYDGHRYSSGLCVRQTNDNGFIIAAEARSADGYGIKLVKTDQEGNLTWSKYYTEVEPWNAKVQQTSDGGYIVVAETTYYPYDIVLFKTDPEGIELWRHTLVGALNEYGDDILQAENGGYIVLGSTKTFGGPGYDLLLYYYKPDALQADFDKDNDVDGLDLVAFIGNANGVSIANFATSFGLRQ